MSSITAPAGSPTDVPGITTDGAGSGPIAGDPDAGLRMSPGKNGEGPPGLTPKLGSAPVDRGNATAATPSATTTTVIFSAWDLTRIIAPPRARPCAERVDHLCRTPKCQEGSAT